MISSQNYFCLLICLSWNWAIVQAAENSLSFARTRPATSLIHDQIYFFGGTPVNNILEQSFAFSLNLSIPFNITSPPWTKLAIENPSPTLALMTSDIDNTVNQTIYIFANPTLPKTTVSVYKFNESALSPSLEKVEIQGDLPLSRYEVSEISDNAGNFFMFGGGISQNLPNVHSNEMNIYDSTLNIWNSNVSLLMFFRC